MCFSLMSECQSVSLSVWGGWITRPLPRHSARPSPCPPPGIEAGTLMVPNLGEPAGRAWPWASALAPSPVCVRVCMYMGACVQVCTKGRPQQPAHK